MATRKKKAKPAPAPSKATVKQTAIVADLLTSALHYLGEINRPFVVLLQDCPDLLTNMPLPHARRILQDAANLQDKLSEAELEEKVDRLTAIPPEEGGATGTSK